MGPWSTLMCISESVLLSVAITVLPCPEPSHILDKLEILQPKENSVREWFICLAGAPLPVRVQVPFEVVVLSRLT